MKWIRAGTSGWSRLWSPTSLVNSETSSQWPTRTAGTSGSQRQRCSIRYESHVASVAVLCTYFTSGCHGNNDYQSFFAAKIKHSGGRFGRYLHRIIGDERESSLSSPSQIKCYSLDTPTSSLQCSKTFPLTQRYSGDPQPAFRRNTTVIQHVGALHSLLIQPCTLMA